MKKSNGKNINVKVVITALCCITAMEIAALCLGYNGTLLKISIAAVAGLAGLVIPSPIKMG